MYRSMPVMISLVCACWLASMGCGGCPVEAGWCSSNANCDPGFYCNPQTAMCAQDCVEKSDCPADQECNQHGQCTGGQDTDTHEVDTDPCGDPVLLLIDRSRSMNHDGRWIALVEALSAAVLAFDDDVDFGLVVFPDDSCDRTYDGNNLSRVCRGPDNTTVDIGPKAGASIRDSLESLGTCGGTPMSQALAKAADVLGYVGGDAQLVLITDGLPNCNTSISIDDCECMLEPPLNCQNAPEHCLDIALAKDRAVQILSMGTPVHVLAFEMAEEHVTLLDDLAAAGGTGEAVSCVGGEALEAALTAVLSTITDC